MQLMDFEQDKTYRVTQAAFTPPDSDVAIPGKVLVVKILAPLDAEKSKVYDGETVEASTAYEVNSWCEFLRVENQESKRVHLLHPETLVSAELI